MTTEIKLKDELDVNSRFSIHDVAPLSPGTCFFCNSDGGDDRKFLDFGKQIKFYGAVYVCSYCIREISEATGYYPGEILSVLMIANEELTELKGALQKELKGCNESLRAISGQLSRCNCGPDGPYSDGPEDIPIAPEAESDDPDVFEPDGVKGSGSVRDIGDDE